MLTFFDVFLLSVLFIILRRRPEFEIMPEAFMFVILTTAVGLAFINSFVRSWFVTAHRFLL